MKIKVRFAACAVVAGLTSGCSYLESFFPDKERDYQYTTETPLLNWPSGLRQNTQGSDTGDTANVVPDVTGSDSLGKDSLAEAPPSASESQSAQPLPGESSSTPPSEPNGTDVTPAGESDVQETVSSVEIVKYDDGESRLRLGTNFSKAWRVVNKALTRNTIEVTERNHDLGTVKIYYDPDEKKAKDDSFMDELDFIFKGIEINDKEYNLKFEEHGGQTDLIVLDDEHLPLLNDNNVVRFLKMIADTIKTDLSKKTQ